MATYPPARGPEDAFNPYASPSASLRRSEDEFGYPPLGFGVSEVLARSWAIYRSRMGFCIGIVLGWFVVYFGSIAVLGGAPVVLAGLVNNPTTAGLVTIGLTVAIGLLAVWLNIGLTIVMLKIARGRLASFGDLFSGGPYILASILAGLILGLLGWGVLTVAMLPVLLAGALAGRDPTTQALVMIAGGCVAFLVLFGLSLRMSQFPYAIVDRGVGPIESLRISARATSGKWLSLFLIFLIVGLINFAGSLALLVGLIFTMPFSLLILAVTYTSLVDGPKPAPDVPPAWRKPEPSLDF